MAGFGKAATPSSGEHKATQASARDLLPFGVFGSLEFATNAAKGLGEWKQVTAKIDAERALYARCDQASKNCPENLLQWRAGLKKWSSLGAFAKLAAVNAYVNGRIRYSADAAVYGREDFWASPSQSLGRRGDCEDYAIAKYESLRALGFAEGDLRLVILKDTRRGIGHAVLSVRLGRNLYILDNQKARPFLHDSIAYYAPVFSINREGRWINIATRKIRSQYAIAAEERGDPAVVRPVRKIRVVNAATLAADEGNLPVPAAVMVPEASAEPARKNAQPVKDWAREIAVIPDVWLRSRCRSDRSASSCCHR